MTHRPLIRLRAVHDFLHEGREVRAGEPLIVGGPVAAWLIAAGDAARDETRVTPWPRSAPALLRENYKVDR
jgi:hypothetical protein